MTKTTKKKLDIEETENDEIGKPNDIQETTAEPTQVEKPKRTKKDRSPAQIAAFEKCLKQRREKAELQKLKKQKEQEAKQEME